MSTRSADVSFEYGHVYPPPSDLSNWPVVFKRRLDGALKLAARSLRIVEKSWVVSRVVMVDDYFIDDEEHRKAVMREAIKYFRASAPWRAHLRPHYVVFERDCVAAAPLLPGSWLDNGAPSRATVERASVRDPDDRLAVHIDVELNRRATDQIEPTWACSHLAAVFAASRLGLVPTQPVGMKAYLAGCPADGRIPVVRLRQDAPSYAAARLLSVLDPKRNLSTEAAVQVVLDNRFKGESRDRVGYVFLPDEVADDDTGGRATPAWLQKSTSTPAVPCSDDVPTASFGEARVMVSTLEAGAQGIQTATEWDRLPQPKNIRASILRLPDVERADPLVEGDPDLRSRAVIKAARACRASPALVPGLLMSAHARVVQRLGEPARAYAESGGHVLGFVEPPRVVVRPVATYVVGEVVISASAIDSSTIHALRQEVLEDLVHVTALVITRDRFRRLNEIVSDALARGDATDDEWLSVARFGERFSEQAALEAVRWERNMVALATRLSRRRGRNASPVGRALGLPTIPSRVPGPEVSCHFERAKLLGCGEAARWAEALAPRMATHQATVTRTSP